MKRITIWLTGCWLALSAGPVLAGTPMQMWHCELDDEATEEALLEHIAAWASAARKLPGAEKMKFAAHFPVAAQPAGESDILITMTLTSFEDWGKFWDAYPDSDAADLEDGGPIDCPASSVWEEELIE